MYNQDKKQKIIVTLQGRCDERGTTEYNLALGAFRAGNAAHTMIASGIEPNRIKTVSFCKENPIYPGTGEKNLGIEQKYDNCFDALIPTKLNIHFSL